MHFLLDTKVACKELPFSRKYKRVQENSTEDLEKKDEEEREAFAGFLERLESETVEEGETNPVVYDDAIYPIYNISCFKKLAFATADNPFYKPERNKYYPEVVIADNDGTVVARMNPFSAKENTEYGLSFFDDFRDSKLKMNDDKKIRLDLAKVWSEQVTVFFLVKTFDLSASPPTEGEFGRAMFRLLNEDTNQTIDYREVSMVELPEGFEEDQPAEEPEDGAPAPPRKELTYFAGRLLREGDQWLYETFGHVFTSDQYPDLGDFLANIHRDARKEYDGQQEALKNARDALQAKQEEDEKRNALRALQQNKKKKGKQQEAHEEEKKEEVKVVETKKELDLNLPKDFAQAIEAACPRSFVFGPVTLQNLDNDAFNDEACREAVLNTMKQSTLL